MPKKMVLMTIVPLVLIGAVLAAYFFGFFRGAREQAAELSGDQESTLAQSLPGTSEVAADNVESVTSGPYSEELLKFKTKSGVEVSLVNSSVCKECDAGEFYSFKTAQGNLADNIPASGKFNFPDEGSARYEEVIIYGECSDEIWVYSQKTESAEGEEPDLVSYNRWRLKVLPDGSGQLQSESIRSQEFNNATHKKDFGGCQVFKSSGLQ